MEATCLHWFEESTSVQQPKRGWQVKPVSKESLLSFALRIMRPKRGKVNREPCDKALPIKQL